MNQKLAGIAALVVAAVVILFMFASPRPVQQAMAGTPAAHDELLDVKRIAQGTLPPWSFGRSVVGHNSLLGLGDGGDGSSVTHPLGVPSVMRVSGSCRDVRGGAAGGSQALPPRWPAS